ncbi:4Fe-4S dicluster domain-containing protein [Aquibium carbonis]|uniref:4Fe-4S dicluster domain-containing protein n=1 Tax=Aquibium carbonis TaxID=2495581 RepID=A0A429YS63_9HYPH|nr:4Fe-4S dicluster domain-containing protein [Aquibium carbonis]RST84297.1 4Fe-4S dicluster domain-containing protein [Aquibium carbonis]
MGTIDFDGLAAALAVHGLIPRGGIDFAKGETAPPGPSGASARAVLLVGHAGSSIWPHFQAWRATQPAGLADPLDAWSRQVIGAVAVRFGARAVSPSDQPWLPFQAWAMRAEGLRPSPLGLLMHPVWGLWHAFRGALLFDNALERPRNPDSLHHPCDACIGKPCLKACPVAAHAGGGFDYPACLGHVRSPSGSACASGGCLDRRACPVGTEYRYEPAQQAFHMAAFASPSIASAPTSGG